MTVVLNNAKLINETTKMLKQMTTSSLKEINHQHIEYIIFHRNGICSAIIGKTLSNGEILIISRFLNLVFKNNLISLPNLGNQDFSKLLTSLLNGLKIQKDNYYWTTALGILSQQSIVEFFCQSKQTIKSFKNIFLEPDQKVLHLVKSTIISISNFLIKLLEQFLSHAEYINVNIVPHLIRISCFLIAHLLSETGISGNEIQTITKYLFKIRSLAKLKSSGHDDEYVTKDEGVTMLSRLNEDSILNSRLEVVNFIRNMLPFLAKLLEENEIMEPLCKCCSSILQRTVDPADCVKIVTVAGEIIYYASNISPQFLHKDFNVKCIMSFIKVLPSNVQHSDARNVLWWHVLCSMTPALFQNRFKTYFIPFLENILGEYFNQSKSSYGISEYNLSNGYLHLSQLTNHVIINILDNINLDHDVKITNFHSSEILVSGFMHFAKLGRELFTPTIQLSDEYMGYIIKAVYIWINILKRNQINGSAKYIRRKQKIKPRLIRKRKLRSLDRGLSEIENELFGKTSTLHMYSMDDKFISHEHFGRKSNQSISLSSDETEISIIPNAIELPSTNKNKKGKTYAPSKSTLPQTKVPSNNGHEPSSHRNSDQTKQSAIDSIRTKQLEMPLRDNNAIEMKNLLRFFKCDSISEISVNKSNDSKPIRMVGLASRFLPLKKRKINIDSDFSSNVLPTKKSILDNKISQSLSSHSIPDQAKQTFITNQIVKQTPINKDLSLVDLNHPYFLRNPDNNNSINRVNKISKSCYSKGSKKKLPKSNVDVTVNVTESSQCPHASNTRVSQNKVHSKKVEFKIKFDLNPITKICSSGLELGSEKNANSNHNSHKKPTMRTNWKLVQVK